MILLKNGTYIDWQTLEFIPTDVLVEPGPDGKLIFGNPAPGFQPSEIVDCRGKFITKSFANAHHHIYSALARGMPAPRKNPVNFTEILKYIWWNLDKALDTDVIHASALVTAMACARQGVTFVIDHHASPFAIEGCLETIARAFDETGVSHLLCYEISDRDGRKVADKGLAETTRYLADHQGLVGLHASFTVGAKTLAQAVALAQKTRTGIHIHVAEDLADQHHCLRKYGKRVIDRLDESGALQLPGTILAHCLHLDEIERAAISCSEAWVVVNMESNLNNGVGFFRSEGLGDRIMLGTDGMHSDMLQSAKSAWIAGHLHDPVGFPEVYRRFRQVHHYLQSMNFTGDGQNNLVVLDYDTPTPFGQENFPGHFIYGITSAHVQHVISNGRLIVKDHRLTTIDEEPVLEFARSQARRLWQRMSE